MFESNTSIRSGKLPRDALLSRITVSVPSGKDFIKLLNRRYANP